jgi:hypothetical protein
LTVQTADAPHSRFSVTLSMRQRSSALRVAVGSCGHRPGSASTMSVSCAKLRRNPFLRFVAPALSVLLVSWLGL